MGVDEHIERIRRFLADEGLKFTRQRRAIIEVFYSHEEHYSLSELLRLAQKLEPSIGYATVYRTMKLLEGGGFAIQHQFADGHARFEPAHEGEHHDHIICVRCGRIVEFEDSTIERRQDMIAEAKGFRVTSHKLEIYGECVRPGCEERQDDSPMESASS